MPISCIATAFDLRQQHLAHPSPIALTCAVTRRMDVGPRNAPAIVHDDRHNRRCRTRNAWPSTVPRMFNHAALSLYKPGTHDAMSRTGR